MPNSSDAIEMAGRMSSLETEMRLHSAECVSYRLETRDQLRTLMADVRSLLDKANEAKGSSAANSKLFGALPNVFWTIIIGFVLTSMGSTVTIIWLRLIEPIHSVVGK